MFQMNNDDEVFLNPGNNQERQLPEFNPNEYNTNNSEETVVPRTLEQRPSTSSSSSSTETPSNTVSFYDF